MLNKKIALRFLLLFLSIMVILPTVSASAETYIDYESQESYYSYEYNGFDEIVLSPDGYYADRVINISDLGLRTMDSSLTDFCFFDNKLYLLDGGEGRVIILDSEYQLIEIITYNQLSHSKYPEDDMNFKGASGIWVDSDARIFICDTQRERILIVKDKEVVGMINRPDTSALSKEIVFDVKKIVGNGGNYYVTAESITSGALVFDENYEFVRFFGSNNVTVTAEVLLRAFQNLWMSDEQIAASRKFSASKISGIDIDNKGFIVVTSSDPELTLSGSAVRCLNFKGSNISDQEEKFGDFEVVKTNANQFMDISVDADNFYCLLDSRYGRVFVYSAEGDMVTAFGGIGDTLGTFLTPIAIQTVGNDILVLDSEINGFTVFKITDYCNAKKELISIIDSGDYKTIATLSEKVLNYNTNCKYAYYAKGFLSEANGKYDEAMSYYKIANDRDSYSQAYKLYRKEWINSHFEWLILIFLGLISLVIITVILLNKGLAKKQGAVYAPLEHKAGFPIYCLFHPADGFSQIRLRSLLSKIWGAIILFVWVYISVLRFFNIGYIFNENQSDEFNLLIIAAKTIGIATLFIISNWAVCTLMDGKGKPKEIVYVTLYSLIPYIISLIITFLLSRFITAEESIFISIFMVVGIVWSAITIFIGLLTIHEYNVGKGIFSIILTILGMAVMVLLIIMFCTLMAQTFSFFQSIIQEYSLRT